jgi:hypothetical protein
VAGELRPDGDATRESGARVEPEFTRVRGLKAGLLSLVGVEGELVLPPKPKFRKSSEKPRRACVSQRGGTRVLFVIVSTAHPFVRFLNFGLLCLALFVANHPNPK